MHDGVMRNYDVHLPQDYAAGMPLVFMIPGYAESKEWIKAYTEFHQYADTSGFVLAVPLGTTGSTGRYSWNIGIDTCPLRGVMPTVNDVGFVSSMIDSIHAAYAIDLRRVYATGFSTGGELCFRLAAELGHRFAAIASVAGSMYDPDTSWQPVAAVPTLMINGTHDNAVFYYHSDSTIFEHHPGEWPVPKTLEYWIANNGCSVVGDTVDLADLDTTDNCWVQKMTWTGDSLYADVVHYKIINGGHHWPRGTGSWANSGNINMDIDGNDTIWKFFQNYTNPHTEVAYITDVSTYFGAEGSYAGDIQVLIATLTNPGEHSVSASCVVEGETSGELYPVTMHDGLFDEDNTFGGTFYFELIPLHEEIYEARFLSTDSVANITVPHHETVKFTTIGPLVAESILNLTEDLGAPGEYGVQIPISNHGDTTTARDIVVVIYSDHESISGFSVNKNEYGDIPAGETRLPDYSMFGLDYFWFETVDTLSGELNIAFYLDIYSGETLLWQDEVVLRDVVGISDQTELPKSFMLGQNYPNPFNPSTTISYQLPSATHVTLSVYDINGREIASLVNNMQNAGTHNVTWNGLDDSGSQVSTGVYLYRLDAADFSKTIKMLFLK